MRRFTCSSIVIAAALAAAAPAAAQNARRPDLGVFARTLTDPRHSLVARGTLGVTFFDVLKRPSVPGVVSLLPDSGWGANSSGTLDYHLRFASATISASAGAVAIYYPRTDAVRVHYLPAGNIGAGWTLDLSKNTSLTLGSSVGARPRYLQYILPTGFARSTGGVADESLFLPPDSTNVGGTILSWNNDVTLRHDLSRRLYGTLGYGYRVMSVLGANLDRRLTTNTGTATLHFNVTRNLRLFAGYRFTDSRSTTAAEPLRTHSIVAGADYDRGLTLRLTRHTTLSLGGGVSTYVNQSGSQRYRLSGDANLAHDFGRTWTSSAVYSRGVSADDILFDAPILYDRVTFSLGGLVTRRLQAHAGAFLSRDAIGFSSGETRLLRGVVSAGVQMAIARHLSVATDYSLYYRSSGQQVRLPSGLDPTSASQGVRAYLSLWVPIFEHGGRTDAAR